VAEACEYDRSFHNLHPRVALITNIEEDHLDCYTKGINEIVESFHHFAGIVPANGLIIANGEDQHVIQALDGLTTPIELVGFQPGFAWSVREVEQVDGCHYGEVSHDGEVLGILKPALAGRHNLFNAAMATAACVACGVDAKAAMTALGKFEGVDRRMTVVGTYHGATVVDDYGHHPTEIQATLKALREKYHPRRLLCVFQPHQHSRTRFLLQDFATSFELADETIVPDIYFVRDSETEKQLISSAELVSRVKANGQHAVHLPEFEQIVSHLKQTLRDGDLVVTMGAGNVCDIGRDLVE